MLDDERPARGQPHLAVEGAVELLVDVVALEQRQLLGLGVVVLDAIGESRRDARDVLVDLLVEVGVVDDHGAVVLGELLPDHPHRHVRLPVQQRRRLRGLGQVVDLVPQGDEALDVVLDLLGRHVLRRGAHDDAVLVRLDAVQDLAEPLALVVGQPLGDAVRAGVRHQHDEATREADLLGQPGALHPDGVLGDLADDGLLGLEHVFDLGLAAALDVVGVVGDIAAVEHGVLRRADVDERRLHAGQHVGHPGQVDVAVDLGDVVGGPGDVVLDQLAALEHGDLGRLLRAVHGHEVATDRLAVAVLAAAGLELGLVELHGVEAGVELDGALLAVAAALAAVAPAPAAAPATGLGGVVAVTAAAVVGARRGAGVADLGLVGVVAVAGRGAGALSSLPGAIGALVVRRRRPVLGVGHGGGPFS